MNVRLNSFRPIPLALLLAATLAAPLSQAADAATMVGHGRHGDMMMRERALQSVGASTDQQTKIKAIMKQARDDVRQQRQASGNLHLQLAQVLAAPTVDATAAEGLRQKMLAQQDSASQRMLQAKLQAAAVLTPEQRQKLQALNEERRARWQNRQQAPAGA